MKTFSRREFFAATASTAALTASAVALDACANSPASQTPTTPSSVISNIGTAVTGLQGALTQTEAIDPTLIPSATAAKINGYLTDAATVAAKLTTSLLAPVGATTVQTIDNDLNAVFAVIAAPPINNVIPPPYNLALTAVAVLLPGFEAFVNQYLPVSTTPSAVSPAAMGARQRFSAVQPGMTEAQALSVLSNFAKK